MRNRIGVAVGLLFLGVLVAGLPVLTRGQGATESWQTLPQEVQTSSEMALVSRVRMPQTLDRMQRVQQTLVAVLYPTGCAHVDCSVRDVGILRPGQIKFVRDIPAWALETERILDNDGRVFWTVPGQSSARFDVMQLNLETGTADRLARDVFLGDARAVRIYAEGQRMLFEVSSPVTSANRLPSVVVREGWLGSASMDTRLINQRSEKSWEEVQDVSPGGAVLTRYRFANGDQELWYHVRPTQRGVLPLPGSHAVEGSYTIEGHLVGAHFVDEDTIEFFRYQQLMRYTISTGELRGLSERLSWVASATEQEARVISADGTLYFVGEDAGGDTTLVVRTPQQTTRIGSGEVDGLQVDGAMVTARTFTRINSPTQGWLTNWLFATYAAEFGAKTQTFTSVDLDELGTTRAWIDGMGSVYWSRTGATGQLVGARVGYGKSVYLLGETDVLWIGNNEELYTAKLRPSAVSVPNTGIRFLRTAHVSTVYAVMGTQRWLIPDVQTYLSWAPSFEGVQVVDTAALNQYPVAGTLSLKPGTLIKTATSPHVMVVQAGWKRQRIGSEALAAILFGSDWVRQVRTVEPTTMNAYQEITGAIESVDAYTPGH